MTPDTIILHHSLTADGRPVNWQAIRRFHTSHRRGGVIVSPEKAAALRKQGVAVTAPWRDIGYHFGIERVNDRHEILMGRMPNEPGAHCAVAGMNHRSIGICFVGDFDIAPPADEQWRLGLRLVRALMIAYGIGPEGVRGHREIDPRKTCPGNSFHLDLFRSQLHPDLFPSTVRIRTQP